MNYPWLDPRRALKKLLAHVHQGPMAHQGIPIVGRTRWWEIIRRGCFDFVCMSRWYMTRSLPGRVTLWLLEGLQLPDVVHSQVVIFDVHSFVFNFPPSQFTLYTHLAISNQKD